MTIKEQAEVSLTARDHDPLFCVLILGYQVKTLCPMFSALFFIVVALEHYCRCGPKINRRKYLPNPKIVFDDSKFYPSAELIKPLYIGGKGHAVLN